MTELATLRDVLEFGGAKYRLATILAPLSIPPSSKYGFYKSAGNGSETHFVKSSYRA